MSATTKPKQTPARPKPQSFTQTLAPFRTDFIIAAVLAALSFLIWCGVYNRWTADDWNIPIFYPHLVYGEPLIDQEMDMARADVMQQFAIIKAASEGHILPVLPTNIPELGAPYGANWDDYPFTEKAIYWMLGIVAKFIGIFAATNFASMLEDVLAAVAFFAACRMLNGSRIWSFVGGLVFAFARFGFAHGIHHIPTAYVWHVPLCLLVFHWIVSEEGVLFRTRRLVFALAVAFFTGIQNPYNTNMFAQLVLIGGLVAWWKTRDWQQWRVCLPAASIIGAAAAAFLFVNSNTFLYHMLHGGNPGAVVRSYRWMEIYGLKLVDMVMPPPDHRFGLFALWSQGHINPPTVEEQLALQPGETPPTAYLGLIALAALAWLTWSSIRAVVLKERVPIEAWLVLWIYLYADVGGINGVVGTLGFQLFRATTRYSLWILCVALMYGVRRMSGVDFKGWITKEFGETPWADWCPYGIGVALVAVALFDQTPPVPSAGDLQKLESWVVSDRNFTQKMEQSLPPKGMVFQLPVMQFPEVPKPISSYDNMRPYLYSRELRYSFGTDKGRGTELWQEQVFRLPFPQFIAKLEQYGFSGLYVNRVAFQDGGIGFIQNLKSMGYDNLILSEKKDIYCVVLKPSPTPIKPDADPSLRDAPPPPLEGSFQAQ